MTIGTNVGDKLAVYLDANVFIDAVEREPAASASAVAILAEAQRGALQVFTSELTLAEVLLKPEREKRVDLKRAYLELFGPERFVILRPVSRHILIESTRYRAIAHPTMPGPDEIRRNFLPDAVHVVTAIDVGAAFYVGRDRRIRLPSEMLGIRADEDGVRKLLRR